MRITSKGQVTIPIDIRKKAGLLPDTEVEFVMEDGKVIIRPADGLTKGERMVARLRNSATAFAGMTTDEIMEMTRGPFNDVEGDEPASHALHETLATFDDK